MRKYIFLSHPDDMILFHTFYCSIFNFAQCEDSVTNSVIDTVTNAKPRMCLPLYYHLCQGDNVTASVYMPICVFDCEQNNFKNLGRILMKFSGNVF